MKKLNNYFKIGSGIKKPLQNSSKLSKTLLASLPVLVFGNTAYSQCAGINVHNNADVNGLKFDVDGDGAVDDFSIFDNGNSAFIKILNPDFELMAAGTPGSVSAFRYGTNANIDGNAADFALTAGDAFLAYISGGLSGQFATEGYVGFRKDLGGGSYNYGFLHVDLNFTGTGYELTTDFFGTSTGSGTVSAGVCNSLPVELSELNLVEKAASLQISWVTKSEENNAGFELQRSTNGETFTTISFIEGNGTTIQTQEYAYDDRDVRKNTTYYYRLKQIDFDGSFNYSDVVSGALQSSDEVGLFYPNPTKGTTRLDFMANGTSELNVTVFNLMGQEMMTEVRTVAEGENTLSFDFSSLTTGNYVVKLTTTEGYQYKKISIE